MKVSRYLFLGYGIISVLSSCAVVPVNRFQSAKTLGMGNGEVGAAFYAGRDVAETFLAEGDPFDDANVPTGEMYGRLGVLEMWDVGFRLFTPYLGSWGIALDQKVWLFEGGIFAPDVAIGSTIGTTGIYTESGSGALKKNREYNLYFFDVPLILSKNFTSYLAVYGGGMFSYYVFNGKETTRARKKSIDGNTASGTAFLGIQASLFHIRLTPEIAVMSIRDENSGKTKMIFFPGIALGFYL